MSGVPDEVNESDLEDLYSPWRSAFALVVAVIGLGALALYPPTGPQAWVFAAAGGLVGYAVGITDHIVGLEERRVWRWAKRRVQGVADD